MEQWILPNVLTWKFTSTVGFYATPCNAAWNWCIYQLQLSDFKPAAVQLQFSTRRFIYLTPPSWYMTYKNKLQHAWMHVVGNIYSYWHHRKIQLVINSRISIILKYGLRAFCSNMVTIYTQIFDYVTYTECKDKHCVRALYLWAP